MEHEPERLHQTVVLSRQEQLLQRLALEVFEQQRRVAALLLVAEHLRWEAGDERVPLLEAELFLPHLVDAALLEDRPARSLGAVATGVYLADPAAAAGLPDPLEIHVHHVDVHVLEAVRERLELRDLHLLAGPREDRRLAHVQERVPHALEVAEDEQGGDEILRGITRTERAHDLGKDGRVALVHSKLHAAEVQRLLHVHVDDGRGGAAECALDEVKERGRVESR